MSPDTRKLIVTVVLITLAVVAIFAVAAPALKAALALGVVAGVYLLYRHSVR